MLKNGAKHHVTEWTVTRNIYVKYKCYISYDLKVMTKLKSLKRKSNVTVKVATNLVP